MYLKVVFVAALDMYLKVVFVAALDMYLKVVFVAAVDHSPKKRRKTQAERSVP